MPEILISSDQLRARSYRSEKELNSANFRIRDKLNRYQGSKETVYNTLVKYHATYNLVRENLVALLGKEYRETISHYLSAFSMYVGSSFGYKILKSNNNNFYYAEKGFFKSDKIDFTELHPAPLNKTLSIYSSFLGMKIDLEILTSEFYSWINSESLKMKDKKDYKTVSDFLIKTPVKIENLVFNGFYSEEQNVIAETTFDSIGGYEKIKKFFFDIGRRLQNLERYSRYAHAEDIIPKGILIYGPPGTGKTTFEKAFCSTFNLKYKIITGPEVRTKFVNESANLLSNEMEKAREFIESGCCKCYAILIDEIEEFTRARGSTNDIETDKIVNVFNTIMDGLKKIDGLIIIGSTNNISLIDEAVLSRFDYKIKIENPDFEARKKVFEAQLKNKTKGLETKLGEIDYSLLANETNNFSCRDITYAIKNAISEKADRIILLSEPPIITTEDIIPYLKNEKNS